MSILFSAIAKGTQVLAECASCVGNFTEVTAEILPKISPHDNKLTISSGNFFFHYVSENTLIYFCITDDKFPRLKAFTFIYEIQRKFKIAFGDVPLVAIPYAALKQAGDGKFSRVLECEMERFNDNKVNVPKVQAELKELKSIMVQNVDRMALRGERLENLMDRADGLSETSHTYRSSAVRVQRKYWWQNMKMRIALALALILVVYFIGTQACGGLAWKNCVG